MLSSVSYSVLLRALAHLDQHIASAESRLLGLLEPDDAHRLIQRVAKLYHRRRLIEDELTAMEKH